MLTSLCRAHLQDRLPGQQRQRTPGLQQGRAPRAAAARAGRELAQAQPPVARGPGRHTHAHRVCARRAARPVHAICWARLGFRVLKRLLAQAHPPVARGAGRHAHIYCVRARRAARPVCRI